MGEARTGITRKGREERPIHGGLGVVLKTSPRSRRYKITEENLLVMQATEVVCQICETPFGLGNPQCLDHDHADGRPRGMLVIAAIWGSRIFKTA